VISSPVISSPVISSPVISSPVISNTMYLLLQHCRWHPMQHSGTGFCRHLDWGPTVSHFPQSNWELFSDWCSRNRV